MEYLHKIDLSTLASSPSRLNQPLIGEASEVKGCAVNCITTPAGEGSPAGLHTHAVDQIFYILQGTMKLEIAGTEYEAGPGTLVAFPAGVPHRNWNGGTGPTVHLAVNAPIPDPDQPFARPVG